MNNLIPVTLGNIIGGAIFVAAVYWFIYLSKCGKEAAVQTGAAQTATRIAAATARPESMQPIFYVTRDPPTRSMEAPTPQAWAAREESTVGIPKS